MCRANYKIPGFVKIRGRTRQNWWPEGEWSWYSPWLISAAWPPPPKMRMMMSWRSSSLSSPLAVASRSVLGFDMFWLRLECSCSTDLWLCQAVGHGIPDEFLDRVRDVAERFFSLSDDEKRDCWRASDEVEGYGDDLVVSEKQVIDCCFRLFLRVFPQEQRRLNLWPICPTDFGYAILFAMNSDLRVFCQGLASLQLFVSHNSWLY